jgi:hypothetical protein
MVGCCRNEHVPNVEVGQNKSMLNPAYRAVVTYSKPVITAGK